ncbi:hypothetical protein EES47_10830 [Streptomyces sp. ADI98-12]|nr:hypothetical protein EES47_10830 [Streptomyces sp. ADI98-12]
MAVARTLRTTLAATCPASTGVPVTPMLRNRSTTPVRMSSVTRIAVPAEP